MQHEAVVHGPGECLREGSCWICEGGLFLCRVCGCLEGGLATECPGYRVSADDHDAIYAGEIDFIGGRWVAGHRNYAMDY